MRFLICALCAFSFAATAAPVLKTIKLVRAESTGSRWDGPGQTCDGTQISPNPVVSNFTNVGFDEAGNARLVLNEVELHDCRGIEGPETIHFVRDDQESVLQLLGNDRTTLVLALQALSKDCPLYLNVDSKGKIANFRTDCPETGGIHIASLPAPNRVRSHEGDCRKDELRAGCGTAHMPPHPFPRTWCQCP